MKVPVCQYAWEKFRDYDDENDESILWAAAKDKEDRRVFELEVEAMIEESIPNDLEALRRAYKACDWVTIPKNADRDLLSAILAVVIEDGELDAECVFARLQEPSPVLSPPPRPEAELPFPKLHLDTFIACLDHYYQRTIRAFEGSYGHFLKALPETVQGTLEFCYIDLTVPALMDKLREQCNP